MRSNFTRILTLQGTVVATAMGKLRRIVKNDAGSALVEMAMSSTILFAMFFGVFQVVLASYTSHYVSDAAREGARYAIVRGNASCGNTPNLSNCGASPTTIAAYVKGLPYPGIDRTKMIVNVTYLTGTTDTSTGTALTTWATCSTSPCNVPGNMVNVQVSYPYGFVTFVSRYVINVTSTSKMVVQQ